MNIFCFSGNVTRDIELKATTSGKKVASFGIALNEGKDKTTFLNCVAWEKTAELLSEYCKKGDRLSGSGRIDVRSYDKDGEKKYVTEVIVMQIDLPPKGRVEEKPTKRPMAGDMDDSIPFMRLMTNQIIGW